MCIPRNIIIGNSRSKGDAEVLINHDCMNVKVSIPHPFLKTGLKFIRNTRAHRTRTLCAMEIIL